MKWQRPYLVAVAVAVAVAARVAFLGAVPASLETEEASLGHAAWSWLHSGPSSAFLADPVTGVPASHPLYVVLSLPFVAVLGAAPSSLRLVSALAGVASLWMLARLAKREGSTWRDIALLVAVTSPWHLMASRWASGAHVVPALVLAAVLVFEGARDAGVRLVAATLLLSVSAIGSGPAAMLSVVLFAWVVVAAHRAGAPRGALAASLAVSPAVLLTALTLAAGAPGGVLSTAAVLDLADFLPSAAGGFARLPENAGKVVSMLLGASLDGTTFSAAGWGPILLVLVPFLVWGIQIAVNDARRTDRAMLAWFLSALAVACCYRANLRNMSLVFVPALWLSARGLWSLVTHQETPFVFAVLLQGFVAFSGLWFSVAYFGETGGKGYVGSWLGFGEALQRVLSLAPKEAPIIVSARTPNAYVPTLFYANVPPERFAMTANVTTIAAPTTPPAPGVPPTRRDVAGFDRFLFGSGPLELGRAGGRLPYWVAERSEWPQFDSPAFFLESFGRYAVVAIHSAEKQSCFKAVDASRLQGAQDWGIIAVDGSAAAPGAGFYVGGQRHVTGFGVHGESSYALAVSGPYELTFGIGISDAMLCGDGVSFEVLVDGESVFTSSRLRAGDLEFRVLRVSPRQSLTFVTHAGSSNNCDHANWLRPALIGCPVTPM